MSDAADLVPSLPVESVRAMGAVEEVNKLDRFGWMPCTLTLEIPIAGFTIADLLHLAGGSLVESAWSDGRDVPLRINRLLVAWAHFEADGDRMGALITDLA